MQQTKKPVDRFAEFVVSKHKLFLVIFAALCIFSIIAMGWTEVENDVAAYLPDTYEARQGLDIMEKEFETYGSAKILVENITEAEAVETAEAISRAIGVEDCKYDLNDGNALFEVTLDALEGEGEETVDSLRNMFDGENAYIYSEEGNSVSDQITSEVRGLIGIIAVILVVVLTFTSSTYAEVPILLVTFLAAALINKGTNFMLGKISFISDSVTIILQLAMSVDYAIILCNQYKEAHKTLPIRQATVAALAKSLVVISSSSLTTIAGLVAMTFMKFGIGKDLGIALIKAIFISLMTVFLLMPGLLLKFGGLMDKTKHRCFVPKISAIGSFAYKARRIVPLLFLLVIAVAYIGTQNINYAYSETLLQTVKQSENQVAQHKITDKFGDESTLAIVVPCGDYEMEAELITSLSEIDEVKSTVGIAGMETQEGYKLSDEVNYSQFASLAGVDSTSAQALFALYAAENGQSQDAANGLYDYKAPLVKVFVFLSEKANDGTVTLNESQAELVSSLSRQLNFASDQLEGEDYDRIVLTLSVPDDGDETFALLDRIRAVVSQYYPEDSYLVGNAMSAYSFKDTFTRDNVMVSMMSIIMVMIVLLFTFKSVGLPLLLTLVIQGSIWINFGLAAISGRYVLFMVYLVASAIQMGCNVDYAIVVASHYNEERSKGLDPRSAMINAMNLAFPTIITSGTALISAGLLIGAMVSSGAVAGMGHFVGIGSLITVFLVLFVLPSMLLLGDGMITKTAIRLHSADPHRLIRRFTAWGLAAAAVFTMAVSPWVWFSDREDCDERITSDREIVKISNELGKLALNLGAEKERYDEAKLSFAEGLVTDNIGQSQLNKGQSEYDAGSRELADAKAQYADGKNKLEKGKADYAEGERRLSAAKEQYAEGQAKLEKVKPIYDTVQPAYQKYLDMKGEYDSALENGDRAKAALLWPGVEAQKRLYEAKIANSGYSVEDIVYEYESGIQELADAEKQIANAERQLTDAKAQLEEGQRQLDEAKAQIEAGQIELDKAAEQLDEGRSTLDANRHRLSESLKDLERYEDDIERLECGVAALMQDDEVASRVGDGASYADICSVAAEHYSNDADRAERERDIGSTVYILLFTSAAVISLCALLHKQNRTWISSLAAVSAIISASCAVGASVLAKGALIPIAALTLSLFTISFGKIYLNNRKE